MLRARARRREATGRQHHLEHRPPALERHRRRRQGAPVVAPPDGPRSCSPAGASARWPRASRATTRSVPHGTVWPHDTSLIAAGLAPRSGYRAEAARLAIALLEAAEFFRYRLPEAFAGYPRTRTLFPVEYPTACSPQAWASGAPLLPARDHAGGAPARARRRCVRAGAARGDRAPRSAAAGRGAPATAGDLALDARAAVERGPPHRGPFPRRRESCSRSTASTSTRRGRSGSGRPIASTSRTWAAGASRSTTARSPWSRAPRMPSA